MPAKPRKSGSGRLTHCTGKRKPVLVVAIIDFDGFEVVDQGWPVVPGHARRAAGDVVAKAGRDRDRLQRCKAEIGGELAIRLGDGVERSARSKPTRSSLLTASTTWRMPSSEQISEWRRVCTTTPLRASTSSSARSAVEAPVAMLRVYCSWPGVSATMKAALLGLEQAVGDVDGDALLAFVLEAVEEQRQVDIVAGGAELLRLALQRLELVGEDRLAVVEQAADQGRFAVIDRAAGEEPQQASCRRGRGAGPAIVQASEITLALLALHRGFRVAIDEPALALGVPRRLAARRRCPRPSRPPTRSPRSAGSSRACESAPAAAPASRRDRAAGVRHRP